MNYRALLDPKRLTARELVWIHRQLNSDDPVARDFARYLFEHYGMPDKPDEDAVEGK